MARGSAAREIFDHWTLVHLERCAIGPAGCRMLARVLRLPGCRVHTVNVNRQQIGAEGAAALVRAMRDNPAISALEMKLCFVNDVGGTELLELIQDGEGAHRLTALDMSNNMLTFPMCQQLELARPEGLKLVLKGNRVLDEVSIPLSLTLSRTFALSPVLTLTLTFTITLTLTRARTLTPTASSPRCSTRRPTSSG